MSNARLPEHQESLPEGPAPAAGYNTHAVERLTGVPATTFRAWERRYGVPSPRRLPGGQRVYAERDVAVVRWLRQQTEQGLSASMAVAQLAAVPRQRRSTGPGDLSAAGALRGGGAGGPGLQLGGPGAGPLPGPGGAPPGAGVPGGGTAGAGGPGRALAPGGITPAVEHFATALVRRRLEQLSAILETGSGRPLVVMGAAPGEQHEIGVLIMGLFLRRRGLRVIYLGADVSLDAVQEISSRLRPDLLCLSASGTEAAEALRQVGLTLAGLDPPGPRLVFGGRAFEDDPALARGIAGTYLGGDLVAAADAVVALTRESGQNVDPGAGPGRGGELIRSEPLRPLTR